MFERTGIAAMNFNTVYQLVRRVRGNDGALARASTLLLMPDLLGFFLTGERASEYTNVTTTNLYHVGYRDWDFELMRTLGIPERIFTPIDCAGSMRGRLLPKIAEELGVAQTPFAASGRTIPRPPWRRFRARELCVLFERDCRSLGWKRKSR
jgi:rhamnulokinase